MGYYTNYDLTWDKEFDEEQFDKFSECFHDVTNYYTLNYIDTEAVKWYSSHKDMLVISKNFPNVLFTLKGYGEDNTDVWVSYFKNGRVQKERAQIVFPEFDEAKLK